MKQKQRYFKVLLSTFSMLLLSGVLSACGGSDSENASESESATNQVPTVSAGTEQSVVEETVVSLSGTATDSDGSIVSYQWLQTSGTAVTLENATTVNASFTSPALDADETLIFSFTATDDDDDAATDTVNVVVSNVAEVNTAPIANAGTDQVVLVGNTVSLTGLLSSDEEGETLSYQWSFVEIPSGSDAVLSDGTVVSPSFLADKMGTYIAELVVDDGVDSSEVDSVEVTVTEESVSSTDGVLCDYDYSEFNDSESVQYTSSAQWSCVDGDRALSANGIPDHEVGTFPNPGNPNTISEQTVSENYTLLPVSTETATELGGPRGATGYVLNGVKIDASTAGSCDDSGDNCSLIDNSGSWNIEALGHTSFDFGTDDNNAHVQPGGAYHYHGMPEGFVTKQGGNDTTITIIGWAADGFPIYARYGYSEANNADSAIVALTGSYQLISTVSSSRPPVDVYSLGTFAQDWEYVEGSGDLDECNGRYGITPEFPNGIYHYYATDTYPYFQRCVTGEVANAGADGGPPPRP
jgi:hypothetical protein